MYCLQTHETHYFSLLRTNSVLRRGCRPARAPARAGRWRSGGDRGRSWEIQGREIISGYCSDRGDCGRSREIMRGRGRSIEVDRDRSRSWEIARDRSRSGEIARDRGRSLEVGGDRRRSLEVVGDRGRSFEVEGDRSRSGGIVRGRGRSRETRFCSARIAASPM